MQKRSFELAIDLIHGLAPCGTLSVVAAKEAVCGSTIPATDFRRALAYAHGAAWIEYGRDFLSITLTSLGHSAVRECLANPGNAARAAPAARKRHRLAHADARSTGNALAFFRACRAAGK